VSFTDEVNSKPISDEKPDRVRQGFSQNDPPGLGQGQQHTIAQPRLIISSCSLAILGAIAQYCITFLARYPRMVLRETVKPAEKHQQENPKRAGDNEGWTPAAEAVINP